MVDAPPPPPVVRALSCPSCGAPIVLRTGDAKVVVCSSCHAVLDAKDPNLAVLQKMQERLSYNPQIPLGTKGNLKGDPYEAIGFQVRSITADGADYFWSEYLLWNPYKGFRYLTEYNGHWNDVTVTKAVPTPVDGKRPAVNFHGEKFEQFQTATATTRFILGEFPWQVKAGDTAEVRDFVSPPHLLSEETTADEQTWSIGTYTTPDRIWAAFSLPGTPPKPEGVFENQPDTYTPAVKGLASLFAAFAILIVALLGARLTLSRPATIYENAYAFTPPGSDSSAFATPVFPISGRTSNVEVEIDANVLDSWAYFNLALINQETGHAIDFGREVSYYSGVDGGEAWSEGSQRDRSYLSAVPAGNYFLRVQPEGPTDSRRSVRYSIRLRRDVPRLSYYAAAVLLLAVAPTFALFRAWAFERARWQESDYSE